MLLARKHPRLRRLVVLLVALCATIQPATALAATTTEAVSAGLVRRDVTFDSGDLTMHGTVLSLDGDPTDPAGRAGLVLVSGAGSGPRERYLDEAEAFARAGIAVLIYDKRSDYSRATSSFGMLAGDAVAGVRFLRSYTGVDPARVGLWGHSEGGWVAPLAAARSSEVGFVVTVGASGFSSDRTQLWSNRTHLAHAGVEPSVATPIGANLSRMLISAGMFGDTGHDPAAALRDVRQPILGVFAEHDRSTVPGESMTVFREALEQGGNEHYTLRLVSDADHNLRASDDGFAESRPSRFATGYVDLITSWVDDLADGPPDAKADPPPAQAFPSSATAPLAWYESTILHLSLFVFALVAFLGYPVVAVTRRLRGRTSPDDAGWPARLLAVAGPLAVLGTVTYLFAVVSTGASEIGPIGFGRPWVWLLLQILAVGVVAATVAVAAGWWKGRAGGGRARRGRDGSVRVALLVAGGALFVPWATYWGLFTV
ncbi:MAG TPA: prolyl oligopeptidase family serine peptidase [Jiangellaceae bacterium]